MFSYRFNYYYMFHLFNYIIKTNTKIEKNIFIKNNLYKTLRKCVFMNFVYNIYTSIFYFITHFFQNQNLHN